MRRVTLENVGQWIHFQKGLLYSKFEEVVIEKGSEVKRQLKWHVWDLRRGGYLRTLTEESLDLENGWEVVQVEQQSYCNLNLPWTNGAQLKVQKIYQSIQGESILVELCATVYHPKTNQYQFVCSNEIDWTKWVLIEGALKDRYEKGDYRVPVFSESMVQPAYYINLEAGYVLHEWLSVSQYLDEQGHFERVEVPTYSLWDLNEGGMVTEKTDELRATLNWEDAYVKTVFYTQPSSSSTKRLVVRSIYVVSEPLANDFLRIKSLKRPFAKLIASYYYLQDGLIYHYLPKSEIDFSEWELDQAREVATQKAVS